MFAVVEIPNGVIMNFIATSNAFALTLAESSSVLKVISWISKKGKYSDTCLKIFAFIEEWVVELFCSNKNLLMPTPKFGSMILSPGEVKSNIFRS